MPTHILSFIMLLPLLGTFIIGLLPKVAARMVAIVISAGMLLGSLVVASGYNSAAGGIQFEERLSWFSHPFPVEYHVGVDGMALCLLMLTGFVTLAAVLASKTIGENRSKLYYSMLMLLTASIAGVFMAQDLLQFFIMYELELVPMYFLIAIWGGPNRNYAAMKFLIYTFFGGILMFAALLYSYFYLGIIGIDNHTFDMGMLSQQCGMLSADVKALACLGFFLAFIIKLPSFPFHTWLPDAHVEAPTPVSMILAGLLLKMGSYGLVRICLGFFPDVIVSWAPWIMALGAFNIVWGAIACLVQEDMKRIIAFSSVSHMGFILLGIGSVSAAALNGAIFQMISHGVISAALFFLVGTIYDRCHTRLLPEIGGGLAKQMPCIFYFWMLAAMANLGLPGLAGFVAEITVFYGSITSPMMLPTYSSDPELVKWSIVIAAIGVVLSAGYMLWLLKRLFYGPEQARWKGHLSDMTMTEKLVASALSASIIFLGLFPMSVSKSYTSYSDQLCKDIQDTLTKNAGAIQ